MIGGRYAVRRDSDLVTPGAWLMRQDERGIWEDVAEFRSLRQANEALAAIERAMEADQ